VHQCGTDACRRMVSRDPRTKVHEIRGVTVDWPDPYCRQISLRCDKKFARYSLSNFFLPGKWTKFTKNPLRPAAHRCPSNLIALRQTMHEKSVTVFFTLFSILLRHGDPWAKVHQSSHIENLNYVKHKRSILLPVTTITVYMCVTYRI